MADYARVLEGLKRHAGGGCFDNDSDGGCPYWDDKECARHLAEDALELLKAQEAIEARLNLCESCAKEYAECEADKTDLVYGSGVGNDNIIGCPWYMNRWKAQEPVKPSIGGDADGMHGNWWYTCGACLEQIDKGDKFCRWCGKQVKWNDEC